jgi:hypothetical protein
MATQRIEEASISLDEETTTEQKAVIRMKVTPCVDILTLRKGDEKRYFFKCPDGMELEQASEIARVEMESDIEQMGRTLRDYKIIVGSDENGLTMTAVYNPTLRR